LQVPKFPQQQQQCDPNCKVPNFCTTTPIRPKIASPNFPQQQQEIRPEIASPDVSTTTTTTMRPQIASPNVYRQQSERTSQIHIKTAQIGGKVCFSFPFFFGASFRTLATKVFGNGELREVHNVLLQNPLDAKEE
jgi:hypothetical protein